MVNIFTCESIDSGETPCEMDADTHAFPVCFSSFLYFRISPPSVNGIFSTSAPAVDLVFIIPITEEESVEAFHTRQEYVFIEQGSSDSMQSSTNEQDQRSILLKQSTIIGHCTCEVFS